MEIGPLEDDLIRVSSEITMASSVGAEKDDDYFENCLEEDSDPLDADLVRVKSECSSFDCSDVDEDEPLTRVSTVSHSESLSRCTVSVEFLVAFANEHDVWKRVTADVVDEVIRSMTKEKQCRFLDLEGLKEERGPADVFISHSWANTFGLLVTAAQYHSRKGRRLWIDIFAINQHTPAADLKAMKHAPNPTLLITMQP